MAAVNSISAAAVLIFAVTVAGVQPPNPYADKHQSCTAVTQSRLFNKCLFVFGLQHLTLKMSPGQVCDVKLINCTATQKAVECVKAEDRAEPLTASCWTALRDTLSYTLIQYGFKCSYYDFGKECYPHTSGADPLTVRYSDLSNPGTGRRPVNNPNRRRQPSRGFH